MPAARLDTPSLDRPETRLATRLAFLVDGFGIACWAPLVPFAKARLRVDEAQLGLLLLCLGVGSVIAMLLVGILTSRVGTRPIILAGAAGLILLLPLLAMATTPVELAASLLLFGASLGSLDVAMNVHAVQVERAAQRPLMSGFHAFYSLGGILGSSVMTLLLSLHTHLTLCTVLCSGLMLITTLIASSGLLREVPAGADHITVLPRGIVMLLAVLAGITFLAEGAVLDWGALLITGLGLVSSSRGGLGYTLFSVAMTVGRLSGDAVVASVGERAIVFWGALLAMLGFVTVVVASNPVLSLSGFVLIGIGASNIVPVLFRGAGRQTAMPVGQAVAAITTVGYAGVLLGPAFIGVFAKATSLPTAFGAMAVLLAGVVLCARAVTSTARVGHS